MTMLCFIYSCLRNYGSERSKRQLCNLEELLAERNTDYGQAEDAPPDEIADCQLKSADETAEYEPKNITDKLHA